MENLKSAEQIAKQESLDKAVVNYLLKLHGLEPIGTRMVYGYEVAVYDYKKYREAVARMEAMLAEME
jgi:hypothetical protein